MLMYYITSFLKFNLLFILPINYLTLNNMTEFNHQKIEKLLQNLMGIPGKQAKSNFSISIEENSSESIVYKQIDQIVDLSDLKPEMSFKEVIEKLENSVRPPIQIQPNWKDLRENAEVEPSTPTKMRRRPIGSPSRPPTTSGCGQPSSNRSPLIPGPPVSPC